MNKLLWRYLYHAVVLAAWLVLAPAAALAGQNNAWSPTTGTVSGLQLTTNYNNAFSALLSSNSGASAPTNDQSAASVKGQFWLSTSVTPNVVEYYDGANWTTVAWLDLTNHYWISTLGAGTGTIASSTTTDLGTVVNPAMSVTGTTTITSFGTTALIGSIKFLNFTGALTLTYNATSLIIPGGLNITTAAGDTAIAVALGSGNWRVVSYNPATGNALSSGSTFTGAVYFDSVLSPTVGANTNNWAPSGIAAANAIRVTCSAAYNITGILASATDGQVLHIRNVGANTCMLTANDTNSSSGNQLLFDRPISIKPNRSVTIKYDLTSGGWVLWQDYPPTPYQGGFKNLRVFNVATVLGDSAPATPNTEISVAFDELALEDASGGGVKIVSFSGTANIANSGAGGLDTGSAMPGYIYYVWMIYNPSAGGTPAVMFSLSSTAPTMPSGYTFKARVGAANYVTLFTITGFHRMVQYGRRAQYVVTPSSPTEVLETVNSGATGTINSTTFSGTSTTVTGFIPATAVRFSFVLSTGTATGQIVAVAPNNNYAGYGSVNPIPWVINDPAGVAAPLQGEFALESSSVYYAGSGANGRLQVLGWEDNL